MISLNSFVKLILPIVELFADSSTRETPQRRVTTDLVLVRDELNGLEGLLDVLLMVMGMIFNVAGTSA